MDQAMILQIVQILLIAAAINWGLNAYDGTDLVKIATGGGEIEKYVKYAIGAAGVYAAYVNYAK
ncbi:DUF378 domain-containing protein [bacterium]|nr:DUF378 domain-containing protein [bacterium]NDG32727.1 DUF378 domain-containing protein [bacterium]